jgi:hypothetical protein
MIGCCTCFAKQGEEYILVLFYTLLEKSFVVVDLIHHFRIFEEIVLLITFVFGDNRLDFLSQSGINA